MQLPNEFSPGAQEPLIFVGLLLLGLFLAGIASGIAFLVRQSKSSCPTWRSRMRFLEHLPLEWFPVALLIVVLLGAHLLFAILMLLIDAAPGEALVFFLQSILFHWLILLFTVVWLKKLPHSFEALFGFKPSRILHNASRGVIGYLIAWPIIVATGYLYQILLLKTGYQPSQQPVMQFLAGDISVWSRLYGVVLALFIAPLSEEILFRGMLLPVVARKTSPTVAVIAVSILFAGMHFYLPAIIPLFVVSLACCYAYIYTGSLTTPIVLHSVFNSINLGLFLLMYGVF